MLYSNLTGMLTIDAEIIKNFIQGGTEMEKWLKWAIEIQSLAQTGLTYTKDVYDRERYERLREISGRDAFREDGTWRRKGERLILQ